MGDGADVVVERLEDQGVAGGFEVGGAEEVGGLGVGEGDVPAGLGLGLRGPRGPRGRRPAIAWATSRSTTTGPQRRVRSASCSSTQIAPAIGQPVGLAGDPAGLPGRHLQPTTRFHSSGRRWRRSRASAISCAPADGDMPSANANGSGVNAATAGVPSPPSDSSASRAGPPDVSTPVSVVAGCRSAQWAASWSLRNAAVVRLCSASAAASSTPAGSRSPTSYSLAGPWCSWD